MGEEKLLLVPVCYHSVADIFSFFVRKKENRGLFFFPFTVETKKSLLDLCGGWVSRSMGCVFVGYSFCGKR